jgi:4-hydroxybenzoate polyprenyltransferase
VVVKKITDFVLYSSLFISTCAFGLIAQTYWLLEQPVSMRVGAMVFFATIFLYNLDSFFFASLQPSFPLSEKKKWLATHRLHIRLVALVSGVLAAGLFTLDASYFSLLFLLHLLVLSVMYSFPVAGQNFRFLPLRRVPFLKVLLIAYVWAALTVFLPLLYLVREVWEPAHIWMFFQRFLFIFALALLFDIRDYSKDKTLKTYTLPVMIGIPYSKGLSLLLIFLFMALAPVHNTAAQTLALLLSGLFSSAVIIYAHEERPEYFFLGLADGMMLLQAMLVRAFI